MPYPVVSPKFVFCLASAPGTFILVGMSSLVIRIVCPSDLVANVTVVTLLQLLHL